MIITDVFVVVSDDCPNQAGIEPPIKDAGATIARLQYDLLMQHPYEYDIDALNFEVYCRKNAVPDAERPEQHERFFSKSHPCLRASPLTKQYGFGAHYDGMGRIALYARDSVAYAKFQRDASLKVEKAMRNRRAIAAQTA
jgi:hypothetical protein